MTETSRRGGIVLLVDGALWFLPAAVALCVAAMPRVTQVPGAPPELVGVAIHEGAVIPIIAIGAARTTMVVCQHAGEIVGLVGGEPVRSGSFDVVADHPEWVTYEGKPAKLLDVATLYSRVRSAARPARWGG